MRRITVQQGQCLTDIAMQELGGVEGIFLLAADNGLPNGINTVVVPGQLLKIRDEAVSVKVVTTYAKVGHQVANALSIQELALIGGDMDWDDFDAGDFDTAPGLFDFHWPDFHEEDFEA